MAESKIDSKEAGNAQSDLLNSSFHSNDSDNFRLTFDSSDDEDKKSKTNPSKSKKESAAITTSKNTMDKSKVDDGFEETSSNDTQFSSKISELINGIDEGDGDKNKDSEKTSESGEKITENGETLPMKEVSSANFDKSRDDESTNLDDELARMEEQLAKSCDDSAVDVSTKPDESSKGDKVGNEESNANSDKGNSDLPETENAMNGKVITNGLDKSQDEDTGEPGSKEADSSSNEGESKPEESFMETSSPPSLVSRSDSQESNKSGDQEDIRSDMDEESSCSDKFGSELPSARKRPLDSESEAETTCTGAKKIRVEKKHCSDGEQDQDSNQESSSAKKERRRSYSEDDLIQDLNKFRHHEPSVDFKAGDWKQPVELSVEDRKRIEQAGAREKEMRKSVLRLIQRNYKDITTEELEDTMYVAIMDYFCHYNPAGLLQRKVAMLLKLLTTVQENYNRTFRQFCEAKVLLKRLVDIRRDELKKCTCRERLPFKMIRSVAVQVQTSKCRGGDLCPGTGAGLNPKFKLDQSNRGSIGSPDKNLNSKEDAINKADRPAEKPQHVNVSVPPMQQPSKPTAAVKPRPDLTAKPISELQKTETLSPQTKLTRLGSNQVTVSPVNVNRPQEVNKPQADFIDLTDKDEDVAPSKKPEAPVTVQTPHNPPKVITTSVLSPMPLLPPLPATPHYTPSTKRPPQPVLKVCKADQSGIMLSWTLRSVSVNEITSYQVYACQENGGVTREWNTVGEVNALALPMACTLSQFREGHKYHFVVRAVDKFKVLGEFSHPASILLLSKNGTSNSPAAAQATRR